MGPFDPKDLCPEQHRDYLDRLARARMRRPVGYVSASDVVQETIMIAINNREQFRGQTEAEYLGWLGMILARKVADAFRKKPPEVQVPQSCDGASATPPWWPHDGWPTPAQQVIQDELLLNLDAALKRLSPDEQTALHMRYLQQPRASLDAIARELNRPTVHAVASLLARGLEKLRGFVQLEESR